MAWEFERVAGPFEGSAGGVIWDSTRDQVLFSTVDEGRLLWLDHASKAVSEFRRYANRVNGLARGPNGEIYGAQEGGRRLVEFTPDGRTVAVDALLDGKYHNQPSDLVVDRQHRIYFADPRHAVIPFGPSIFPFLDHCSVLRLERDDRRAWTASRLTYDTVSPRAVLLSHDQSTLYVADGLPRPEQRRELRAYPIRADGALEHPIVLHVFGEDHRGQHRGIEGMCLDCDGNIVAVGGWQRSGPGPLVYVFAPTGAVIETHPIPADLPNKCCFGGPGLDTLYVTTGGGHLYRAVAGGRRGSSASLRFAPLRFASISFALLRSGMLRFSSRHAFQASTPCLSNATCSSFAMEAPLLRLDQFRLDHAPSLLQVFHLAFRRSNDLLRERCEQRFKSVVLVDRQHPFVLPIVLEHCIQP